MTSPNDFHLIPESMRGGIILYVCYGVIPGGFLCAVIKNDLHEAAMRADHNNIQVLHIYASVLHNFFPTGSWRGQDEIDRWSEARKATSIKGNFPDSWSDQVAATHREVSGE